MKRRKRIVKKHLYPDILYNNFEVSKFINVMMLSGKKTVSVNLIYKVFNYLKFKLNKNPIFIFSKCINNISPMIEIKKRKVGGSSYNIPSEIRNSRRISLAMKWLKDFSRSRNEKYMYLRLGNEMIDAYNKKGKSFKKKEDIHKMADSNRAYSHYY